MTILKSYTYKTLQGPYLNLNEDHVSVDFSSNLFLLIDSFGGQGVGDKISHFIDSNFSNYYHHLTSDPDSTLPFFFSPQYFIETNALANALKRTHQEIFIQNLKQEPRFRGGASLTALSVSEGYIHLCSLGSNIAIIVNNEGYRIIALPEITGDGKLKVVDNALGLYEHIQFSLKDIRVNEGDRVLILSDGIHANFSPSELQVLSRESRDSDDLLNNLVGIANSRGNKDNLSGILLNF